MTVTGGGPLIRTNLITGFLGVGKTTTIRGLLAGRPQGERWAVLVNEFGEIGVDGGLLEDTGVALEEIPGGCLCCVSARLFTVGLDRLIRHARPDRILIEPTGLGHPAEIIRTLTAPPYDQRLDLRATVTLMDARHLASIRHREHPNWNDQIHLADVLLANKADLYSEADHTALQNFVAGRPAPRPRVIETRQGRVAPPLLDRPRLDRGGALFPEVQAFQAQQATRTGGHHHHEHRHGASEAAPDDWVVIDRQADGFVGRSWLLPAGARLDHPTLVELVDGLSAERVKGIVFTQAGWQHINRVAGEGGLSPGGPPADDGRPRLEVIQSADASADLEALDRALRAGRLP
ncbi:CobW family GTP-binding protein [Alkalilimnicola ehrlichii]|uniref:CobW family GTP-binding protein n=1 Tax=Alkalilimnicola ehrlichii TaxID=351052 RepID=UPI003B9E8FFD